MSEKEGRLEENVSENHGVLPREQQEQRIIEYKLNIQKN